MRCPYPCSHYIFGFVQTNALSQTSVGEGLAPHVLCSHYLSATIYVCIYQKPSSERKGDHEVVEGACVTIKIVLSSPLRTLPQSLRDSSLPEGAFEKFAAIMFVLAVYFLWGVEVAKRREGSE